jgi:boron transporter
MLISVAAVTACTYWGRFNASIPSKLPVGRAFEAAGGRSWLVSFWKMDGDPEWIAIAIPFGFVNPSAAFKALTHAITNSVHSVRL